jgi:hypothetical protein
MRSVKLAVDTSFGVFHITRISLNMEEMTGCSNVARSSGMCVWDVKSLSCFVRLKYLYVSQR